MDTHKFMEMWTPIKIARHSREQETWTPIEFGWETWTPIEFGIWTCRANRIPAFAGMACHLAPVIT